MIFEIPPLPYAVDALQPHIGARTVEIHYEKHHKGYLRKLKDAIEASPLGKQNLEEIICNTRDTHVFNVASQVWNHTFYWNSLAPEKSQPTGSLADAIDRDFGNLAGLRRRLAEAANGEFGSGWAWLLKTRDGRLQVTSSSDADNPVRSGSTPLLTIDVWEHAYYLDYQNERDAYVKAVVENLLNWRFAEKNFGG
jgi:Fe-Mn family superoxide dismutase